MLIHTYVLALVTSFSGLIAGLIISQMAIEEIDHVKRYLKYLNIWIVPATALISTYSINLAYSAIFAALLLIALFFLRERYDDAWVYSCTAALFYVSTVTGQPLSAASMIFIYGASISALNASNHFKKKINGKIKMSETVSFLKRYLPKYAYYLLVGMAFYILFTYFL